MAFDSSKLLDRTGWQIIALLQQNARLSFAEIGRRVGLSLPAVAERVHRLEEAGILTAYRALVDPAQVGLPLTVFIRLTTAPEHYSRLIDWMRNHPYVLEAHHLTGGESFLIKAVVASIPDLEQLIGQFSSYGTTSTSVVLSSPVRGKVFTQPDIPNS
ncbi:MAG: Lrp/AsnC family transcriptional regulator [Thermostichus sp. DG02_5_bins_236]